MNFLKTTIIGGLVFLVPVVVIVLVVGQAVDVMLLVAEPMAELIPIDYVGGIALANVLAGGGLLLLCFLAGLISRATAVRRWVEKAESALLMRIPGYTFIKGVTSSLADARNAHLKPVLVSLPGGARVALQVEPVGTNQVVVYFPGSPNPMSGFVQIVPAAAVEPIDEPMMAVFDHAEQLGRGTGVMLSEVTLKPWPSPPN